MTWSIQVDNLSKRYKLGRGHTQKFDNFYQVITDVFLATLEKMTAGKSSVLLPSRIKERPVEIQSEHMVLSESQLEDAPLGEFWALRDLSFRIDEGQRIGIIGRNGSGKSTLLKILSRITEPTGGSFKFRGRLISLLEIGTGFHPDLTGRENIYLNAKINGMSSAEIRRVFDDIVDFSELGVQIDTPIKRYSSGMYMRLAFSVAAHIQSEILVVDEVLAVGDAGFQKKCLTKMLEIGNSGRTLLFVSHDMDAVKKLCSSALELSHGMLVSHSTIDKSEVHAPDAEEERVGSGQQSVSSAIAGYSIEGTLSSEQVWILGNSPKVPSGKLSVRRISVQDQDNCVQKTFSRDEDVNVCIEIVRSSDDVAGCSVRLDISSVSGRILASSVGKINFLVETNSGLLQVVSCRIPNPFFNAGIFRISVAISDLFDPLDMCSIADAVDVVTEERAPIKVGWATSPDAPLMPDFPWTLRGCSE